MTSNGLGLVQEMGKISPRKQRNGADNRNESQNQLHDNKRLLKKHNLTCPQKCPLKNWIEEAHLRFEVVNYRLTLHQ